MIMQTIPHLLARCDEAVRGCESLLIVARDRVEAVAVGESQLRSQRATHGLAWLATTIEALRQMARWAQALAEENRLGECEKLIVQAAFGEYLSQFSAAFR